MADLKLASAVELYNKAVSNMGAAPMPARDVRPAQEFSEVLRDSVEQAIDVQHQGEQMSMKAVANEADIAEVVTAVANAELTLESVVTIRDRVIQAYQEVIRMPI